MYSRIESQAISPDWGFVKRSMTKAHRFLSTPSESAMILGYGYRAVAHLPEKVASRGRSSSGSDGVGFKSHCLQTPSTRFAFHRVRPLSPVRIPTGAFHRRGLVALTPQVGFRSVLPLFPSCRAFAARHF